MAGFLNYGEMGDTEENGQRHFCSFRKVPSQSVSAVGEWQDLSMAAGNPPPQYYAASPLVAAVLDGNKGIFHGADKAPATKWLRELGIVTTSANGVGQYRMLDYLLYYPFIDLDYTDPQLMDNTVTLPRYTDGEGVRVMGVVVAPTVGGGSFTFDYINQDGVQKTSPTIFLNTIASNIATLAGTQPGVAAAPAYGPFLPLRDGDTGVRSIVSCTTLVPGGGLLTLVLVKPLYDFQINEAAVVHEFTLWGPSLRPVKIEDGAYLGLICRAASTLASIQYSGHCQFVWN